MNKESLYQSFLVLTLCGVAPACTSPDTTDEDDQALREAADEVTGLAHKTPKVPVVIDGVRYAPQDIHLFDGRPLYMIVDLAEPDVLVGFTRQRDFRAAADAKKAALDKSATSQFTTGQYADYFSGDDCTADKMTVYSGWGINDLRVVRRGCNIFGWCVGDWNDVISSLWINGSQTLNVDLQYGGDSIWVGGWGCLNLSPYGFDNVGSSVNVW